MNQVLYSSDPGSENVRGIILKITDTGDLILDGCDSGPLVKEWFGDFDYEYTVTVKAENLPALFAFLAESGQPLSLTQLVELITRRFGHEHGFTEFREFLVKENIAFESFSF